MPKRPEKSHAIEYYLQRRARQTAQILRKRAEQTPSSSSDDDLNARPDVNQIFNIDDYSLYTDDELIECYREE